MTTWPTPEAMAETLRGASDREVFETLRAAETLAGLAAAETRHRAATAATEATP